MIQFTNMEAAGLIPMWLDEDDERSAAEQLHAQYGHGGGWKDFKGFELLKPFIEGEATLLYSGDPPLREVSRGKLRNEHIIMFEYAWVCVVNAAGEFRVARMD